MLQMLAVSADVFVGLCRMTISIYICVRHLFGKLFMKIMTEGLVMIYLLNTLNTAKVIAGY
jgi:hypothetical protein